MALPKLNDNLKFEMKIPSTDRVVTYRPYLVKEEKILLSAFESQDQKQAMRAMVDTVVACVNEDLDSNHLSTFDVEYMFTQIRSKSVGEISKLMFKCDAEGCGKETEVSVDLSTIKVIKEEVSNIIPITDDISIEMRYPTYNSFVENFNEDVDESTFGFQMLENCIVSIMTEEERFSVSDVSKQELNEFIDSMTNKQFEKVGEFLKTVPVMKKTIDFTCECSHENSVTLEGLQDFF
tara:strand:+ start:25 stop:732 length:708 start_codon:yes stop_codon:yes gene_type:complete